MKRFSHEIETAVALSITDLLSGLATECIELEEEARQCMWSGESMDFQGTKRAMTSRARIVVGLPDTLRSFEASGGVVPQAASIVCRGLADIMQAAVEEGRWNDADRVLYPDGNSVISPNLLQTLADQFAA